MEPDLPDDEFADEDDDDFVGLIDCDECGKIMEPDLFDGDDPLLAALPDSSAIYEDPTNDGKRLVMLCSPECLEKIQERFGRQPFVREELWAGKIVRSVMKHPQGVSPRVLEQETGLSPAQILAGFAWVERMRPAGRGKGPGPQAGGAGGASR
ncbi:MULTISPECIES: hypothetical protein [Streptomyces]|uniref:Uncharacterized protein n=2 Tax=Streptomyces rimosus subsp. rimosus TaxID=132474 RepID=L8EGC3_STRR1|nr:MULTISPECIES: hypothetical protein [Streptomyces]KOG81029.1 hypothetical protein ADK78_04425 [Kitasatospora aureofaciens]MYT46078.1 hypothetical protein [Streptomyces sp. SID5471]KOT43792.1 hypothetical protein ADK42_07110 [Streptomyces rimosus subsp. rimosus]KOT44683.1 hypothetical protein ADK84_06115 [Streptomyces sp. NRRL WC-3701]KOT64709.1 hypothetical protein ADK44_08865 [Streptomyces rimosus subsp. rimosus]